jgi:hypothetical protein
MPAFVLVNRRIVALSLNSGLLQINGFVPVENLRSKILMMQSTQNWHRQRATDSLDGARDWRVFLQR